MVKDNIKLSYRQADCLLTVELSRMACEEANKNEPTMSIDLVIGGDHGKGAFRSSIMIYTHFISGRNITIIFRLANDHFKKDNDDIMGNTVIAPIGDGLNNICAGRFLGWRHEGKTQFRIMPHGCTLPSPMGETICSSVWLLVFVTGDLALYAIVLGK